MYTLLRIVLFITTFVVVLGAWKLLSGGEGVASDEIFLSVIIAFVISGVASYFVLSRQREALAQRVEARASKAVSKFDEMRTKED